MSDTEIMKPLMRQVALDLIEERMRTKKLRNAVEAILWVLKNDPENPDNPTQVIGICTRALAAEIGKAMPGGAAGERTG